MDTKIDTLTAAGYLMEYFGVIATVYGFVTWDMMGIALGPPLWGMGKGIQRADYKADINILRDDLKRLTTTLEDKLDERGNTLTH